MPRPREFDPDEALDAAMRVFWAKGFAETSYDDLVLGTGVSRKSLYSVFGDKHMLFIAALQRYRAKIVPDLFRALDAENISAEGIRAMLRNFVILADTPRGAIGCFMARTSADVAIQMDDVRSIIDRHWDDLHKRFFNALLRSGYRRDRADELAYFFVGVMQGFLALAHARAGRERMEPFIEEALKALD